jgi:hypothetical protein
MVILPLGFCPACSRGDVPMHNHHCHLHDAVRAAVQSVLLPALGKDRLNVMFGREQDWAEKDGRVFALLRFNRVAVCTMCNAVDGCHSPSIPGPFFSLSPDELADIRRSAGDTLNEGAAFIAALVKARRAATPDYLTRLALASSLGATIAHEWLGKVI